MNKRFTFEVIILLACLGGCSFAPPYVPDAQPIASGRLTSPNKTVDIPSLSSCTDATDSTLKFNSDEPMTVLVHGCNGSAGRFRSLAQLYAFHGQQAVCFSYDDRAKLTDSADQLTTALDNLASQTKNKHIKCYCV